MITAESISFELDGRFDHLNEEVGKTHVSVRWEPAPRIVRLGVMLDRYDWDTRMTAVKAVREFEAAHWDEYAVEYDILPLDSVTDESFAEA